MNIVPYICGKKKSYNDNSDKIRNFSVFDFNYIPEEPFMREESKQLIDEMLRYEMSGIPMLKRDDFLADVWNSPRFQLFRSKLLFGGRNCPAYDV